MTPLLMMTREEKGYVTMATFPVGLLQPFIGVAKTIRIRGVPKRVNLTPYRLLPFKKSVVCYKCGIEGTHFALQRPSNRHEGWHLNLWGKTPQGHNRLMTCDHLVPKSAGGQNCWYNLGTLCSKCNSRKSSKTVEEFLR
jgi:hypothetical protein